MFFRCTTLAAVAVTGLLAAAPAVANPPSAGSAGSSQVADPVGAVTVDKWADHTVYRPTELGTTRHPVVLWGNGTGAGPGVYADTLLKPWAAAGFIVVAANTAMANSGAEVLAGGRELLRRNDTPGNAYSGKVATDQVAVAGHSQGGAGAINAGADEMVRTVLALQPGPLAAPGKMVGPALFLAGEADRIVDADGIVMPLFEKADQVPAVFAELGGAGHLVWGRYAEVMADWLKYQLLGDPVAKARFLGAVCGLCTDVAWTRVLHNAKAQALS
ncbi:poly(ethylene terephthalate) hydrolase family protein [Nocardia sp. JW2]|uniref:poly(ethylene terephthalate) hydrolase family protein n=1 Tax=Nocardia sp. JW2 TaxID=3450738 RepID=UPI003F426669